MKLGAYPTLHPRDRNRSDGAKPWEVYMHNIAREAGFYSCFGAFGTLAYHLSVDRSNLGLKQRWGKGLVRTPRVAATVGLCSVVSESLYYPFVTTLPPIYSPLGFFLSQTVLGGLVASSLGRAPRSAATAGLLFGTLNISLCVILSCL